MKRVESGDGSEDGGDGGLTEISLVDDRLPFRSWLVRITLVELRQKLRRIQVECRNPLVLLAG